VRKISKIQKKTYFVSSPSTSIFTGERLDGFIAYESDAGHKNEKAEDSDLLFCFISF
jgi:hypothetical protein